MVGFAPHLDVVVVIHTKVLSISVDMDNSWFLLSFQHLLGWFSWEVAMVAHPRAEVITVPHIVQPESGGLPADYHRTTTGKLYNFSYKFLVAVRWLSHWTISPTDFPMDCPVNRHQTYAWKGQELIIVLYIIINKQLITPPSEFCILVKRRGRSRDRLKIHTLGIALLSVTPHHTRKWWPQMVNTPSVVIKR